ncbi:MAG: hypothetical protein WCB50_07600, partial [Pseudolabrys sp.]
YSMVSRELSSGIQICKKPSALRMSVFGKADIAPASKWSLLTQSGHRFGIGHFTLHEPMTDNRSHGTSAVPEGYLVSHLATEASKEGTRAGGSS